MKEVAKQEPKITTKKVAGLLKRVGFATDCSIYIPCAC